jgi:hypothetical protein
LRTSAASRKSGENARVFTCSRRTREHTTLTCEVARCLALPNDDSMLQCLHRDELCSTGRNTGGCQCSDVQPKQLANVILRWSTLRRIDTQSCSATHLCPWAEGSLNNALALDLPPIHVFSFLGCSGRSNGALSRMLPSPEWHWSVKANYASIGNGRSSSPCDT